MGIQQKCIIKLDSGELVMRDSQVSAIDLADKHRLNGTDCTIDVYPQEGTIPPIVFTLKFDENLGEWSVD